MKTITLLLALSVIGISADGSCPIQAKTVCSKALDLFPEKKKDDDYCNRVDYYASCLGRVHHGCSDYFDRIHEMYCKRNSTDRLHGIMKSHIILIVSIISALV
eukprot:XP_014772605.1 PREDICTED: uncharacterized protein LOC106870881 [Octopus bimaculoides]